MVRPGLVVVQVGFVPDHIIDEIRLRSDIVDIVGEHVALKRAGSNFKGLCPFHQEKTPSFMVNPTRQIFRCFGCGAGGNVFTFLMRLENMTFPETVKQLARRAGVTIPDDAGRSESARAAAGLKDQLLAIAEKAAIFYEQQIALPPGARAAKYLDSRGILPETAKLFRIGAAPDAWDAFTSTIHPSDRKALVASGMAKDSSAGNLIDRFRNRLMFPIRDYQGRVVGFAGRALGPEEEKFGKYVNSPETAIYVKGRLLYGLHESRKQISAEGFVMVVEGYLDLIMLHQSGIGNVVAVSGTALTPAQAALMKRYTENVTLVFDGDAAGASAAMRGIEVLYSAGLKVSVAALPQGHDPDSFVRAEGPESFRRLVAAAKPFPLYAIDSAIAKFGLDTPEKKADAVKKSIESIVIVADPIVRSEYASVLAEKTGVKTDLILHELAAADLARRKAQRPVPNRQTGERQSAPNDQPDGTAVAKTDPGRMAKKIVKAESYVIEVLLFRPDLIPLALAELDPADFIMDNARRIYELLLDSHSRGETCDPAVLISRLEGAPEVQGFVAELAFGSGKDSGQQAPGPEEPEKLLADSVKSIIKQKMSGPARDELIKLIRENATGGVLDAQKKYIELR